MSRTPIRARKSTKEIDSISNPAQPSPFDSLPNELLVHVLSFLPARSLFQVPLVCKRWSLLLKEDDVWRAALKTYWGRFPLSNILPGSWKQEFRLRASSRELWGYGEDTNILFDPRLGGAVDVVHVEPFPLKLLCGSTKTGIVSECDIASGTVRLTLTAHQNQGAHEVAWLDLKGTRVTIGLQNGRLLTYTKSPNTGGQHPAAARLWQKKLFSPRYELIPGCFCKLDARAVTVDLQGITRVYDLDGASEDVISFPVGSLEALPTAVAISPGGFLVYGFEDGMVWMASLNGTLLSTKKLFEGPISFVKCEGDLALVAATSGKMILLSIPSCQIHCELEGLAECPTCVRWLPSPRLISTGSISGFLHLWQYPPLPQNPKDPIGPIWERFAHSGQINTIYLDGYKIVSGGQDSLVKIWDTLNGVLLRTLERRARGTKNSGRQLFEDPIDALHVEGSKIIVTSNGRVKCSTFAFKKEAPERKKEKEKATPKSKRRQSPTKFGVETIRNQLDEGLYELEESRYEVKHRADVLFKNTIPGLSDEELLQYAMMLSASEQEQGQTKKKEEKEKEQEQEKEKKEKEEGGAADKYLFYSQFGEIPEAVQLQWAMKESLVAE